jgi:hypothetical protein
MRNCRVDRSHDGVRDLILDYEEVGQVKIKSFSPEVAAVSRIYKLCCNPYAVAAPLNTALDDVFYTEFERDLLYAD